MTLAVSIKKQLPHFQVDITLHCRSGELTAIVGPSGAGKTTLLRVVAGLDIPDQGQITYGENTWTDTRTNSFLPPQQRNVGYVFQDYPLFPHLTVHGNIAFADSSGISKQRIRDLLRLFRIDHLADQRPAKLSGGERQRVAFCQALVRSPDLLLLDEPFSALDYHTRDTLRTTLHDLKQELRIPILHVTHDLREAAVLGDSVIPMVSGRHTPEWLEHVPMHEAIPPSPVFSRQFA